MITRVVVAALAAAVGRASGRGLCGSGPVPVPTPTPTPTPMLVPTPTPMPTPTPVPIQSALTILPLNIILVDSNSKRVEVAAERATCYAVDLCSAEAYEWSFHGGELSWSNSLSGDFVRLYTNWNCMDGQAVGFAGAALTSPSGRITVSSGVAYGAFMVLPSSVMSDETNERANACLFPDLFEASNAVRPFRGNR